MWHDAASASASCQPCGVTNDSCISFLRYSVWCIPVCCVCYIVPSHRQLIQPTSRIPIWLYFKSQWILLQYKGIWLALRQQQLKMELVGTRGCNYDTWTHTHAKYYSCKIQCSEQISLLHISKGSRTIWKHYSFILYVSKPIFNPYMTLYNHAWIQHRSPANVFSTTLHLLNSRHAITLCLHRWNRMIHGNDRCYLFISTNAGSIRLRKICIMSFCYGLFGWINVVLL